MSVPYPEMSLSNGSRTTVNARSSTPNGAFDRCAGSACVASNDFSKISLTVSEPALGTSA